MLADLDGVWRTEWTRFMFLTKVQIFKAKKEDQSKCVYSLIEPIRRSKYPAITPDEEVMGAPLEILCLAILDSIFFHVGNRVVNSGEHQRIR